MSFRASHTGHRSAGHTRHAGVTRDWSTRLHVQRATSRQPPNDAAKRRHGHCAAVCRKPVHRCALKLPLPCKRCHRSRPTAGTWRPTEGPPVTPTSTHRRRVDGARASAAATAANAARTGRGGPSVRWGERCCGGAAVGAGGRRSWLLRGALVRLFARSAYLARAAGAGGGEAIDGGGGGTSRGDDQWVGAVDPSGDDLGGTCTPP